MHVKEDVMYGKGIRHYRKLKNLKQDELADMVGITGSAISRYETGEREADAQTIAKIAEALDVRPSDLRSMHRDIEHGSPASESSVFGAAMSPAEVSAWMHRVTTDQGIEQSVKLLLLMMPQFLDHVSWVVAIDGPTLAQLTGLEEEMVLDHWQAMLESRYLERVGYAGSTFRLVS